MSRPVTLFTGQWADLPLETLAKKAADFGYQGLELACWGDHFEVDKALADPAYCAAKHGVVGFTRALSHAVASRGITVNAICPGWTRTEMAAGRMRELGLTEKDLAASMPIGRMIEPAEVASLALYLSGPAAAGITGQALTLDGGSLA
jgi:NAD(P)-dependent dehydrogenase (short-subunit alcohol dehydrogenase family)